MTVRPSPWSGKTTPASIAARFPTEARRLGISVEAVRDAYAREAFFRRLAISLWRDSFVLKGSVLLVGMLQTWHRPTQDADFLILQVLDSEKLSAVLRNITSLPIDDGVVFDPTSLRLTETQEDARTVGQRAIMEASLGRGRLVFRADLGFNDIVTPAPQFLTFEAVLAEPVTILGSTLVTAIAEKFDAMIDHGLVNTRSKDFYDLAMITRRTEVDGGGLVDALRATLLHRGREIPRIWPAILDEVAADPGQLQRYHRFLAQAGREQGDDLPAAMAAIKAFLAEPVCHLEPPRPFVHRWKPGMGWIPT